ncbi:Hypothetical Protein FCC1311_091692 [Hondaea fermentalgiana]|uniref:Protein N-lysine methyltransferase METTL21A n=1 Tax=Hondaea fermentalgiana TaxID=2315210 RepID=A0A2R5GWA3_9STRA|nr:Hypothetical Protein FCC1311_091692 [Hondaea fermentalgiana]|eukprot:GBG32943.1 Hypothetical Protein FCC1311_091692 [Hondaea fermentalgiana]
MQPPDLLGGAITTATAAAAATAAAEVKTQKEEAGNEKEEEEEVEEEEEEEAYFDVDKVQGHRVASYAIFADAATVSHARANVAVLQVPRLSPLDACLLSEDGEASIDLTGNRVWLGARILAQYFGFEDKSSLPRSVLELGAGTGFVGLALALLGAEKVHCTDAAPEILQLLHRNVALNPDAVSRTVIRQLVWTESIGDKEEEEEDKDTDTYDLVVAAECVYDLGVLPALLSTALRHTRRTTPAGRFLMCNCTSRLLMSSAATNDLIEAKAIDVGFAKVERLAISPAFQRAVVHGAPENQRNQVAAALEQESVSFLSFTV